MIPIDATFDPRRRLHPSVISWGDHAEFLHVYIPHSCRRPCAVHRQGFSQHTPIAFALRKSYLATLFNATMFVIRCCTSTPLTERHAANQPKSEKASIRCRASSLIALFGIHTNRSLNRQLICRSTCPYNGPLLVDLLALIGNHELISKGPLFNDVRVPCFR